jgi:hypothetical protein
LLDEYSKVDENKEQLGDKEQMDEPSTMRKPLSIEEESNDIIQIKVRNRRPQDGLNLLGFPQKVSNYIDNFLLILLK